MKKLFWTMPLALLTLAACGGDGSDSPSSRTLTGTSVAVGNGSATTYARVDKDGVATAYGVRISAAALEGLDEEEESDVVLPMPTATGVVKSVHLGWNPHGHPPLEIYTLPHFDVHFYTISEATREAIPGGPDATATRTPAVGFMASDYALDPVSVPAMGTHATDQTSGEFNGGTFDKTYIYGYYDGKIAFLEPMLTRAFLLSSPNVEQNLRLPEKVAEAGRYPQKMTVRTTASGDRIIEISAMKSMPASGE